MQMAASSIKWRDSRAAIAQLVQDGASGRESRNAVAPWPKHFSLVAFYHTPQSGIFLRSRAAVALGRRFIDPYISPVLALCYSPLFRSFLSIPSSPFAWLPLRLFAEETVS